MRCYPLTLFFLFGFVMLVARAGATPSALKGGAFRHARNVTPSALTSSQQARADSNAIDFSDATWHPWNIQATLTERSRNPDVSPWTVPRQLVTRGRPNDRRRRSSRSPLTSRDRAMFASQTLHDAVARSLIELECVPRKEFHESWSVVSRALDASCPSSILNGRCAVDVCGGHGLVGQLAVLLGGARSALCVDVRVPKYGQMIHAHLANDFPQLAGRVRLHGEKLETLSSHPHAVLFGVHACGPLTDLIIDLALSWRAPVVLVPCCHDKRQCDGGNLVNTLGGPLAVDVTRVRRLLDAHYGVQLSELDSDITAQNRVIVAWPREHDNARQAQEDQKESASDAVKDEDQGCVGAALKNAPSRLPALSWSRL